MPNPAFNFIKYDAVSRLDV